MTSPPNTINREAGDKLKGPRLQKLRCLSLLLDAIEKCAKPFVYAAVEHKDDVFIKDINSEGDYLEQNKNYSSDTAFSFNTKEVINSMVSFCDIWIEYAVKSKDVFLGFYATNEIGQEYNTTLIKSSGFELPDKPILELLQSKCFDYPNLLPLVKFLVLNEYRKQYTGKNGKGNILSLEALNDDDWKKFLGALDWKFGAEDEVKSQEMVIEKIKKCKFYNYSHDGKEEAIFRTLMDLIDEKQSITDLLAKFISHSDVELAYAKSGALSSSKSDDPVYKIWESLPDPNDKRTISDKIIESCNYSDQGQINLYARKTASSRILQYEKAGDKNFLSLRYRVFEKCEEKLHQYIQALPNGKLNTNDEVDNLFKFLFDEAKKYAGTLSTDFHYSLKSDPVIEGIVLELFDSCYLALN